MHHSLLSRRRLVGLGMDDVGEADFHYVRADSVEGVPTFALNSVEDFRVSDSRPVTDTHVTHVDYMEL